MPDAAPGASRGPRQYLQAQARTPLLTHQLAYGVHSQAGDRLTVHRQQDVAQVQGTAPTFERHFNIFTTDAKMSNNSKQTGHYCKNTCGK